MTVSGLNVTLGNLNPFRYRGYYYDTETKLYYLQTRYYDPETGRFLNMDSIDYADPESLNGLNLYAYCNNNPVMYVDPEGTKIIPTSQIIDSLFALTEFSIGSGLALISWIVKTGAKPNNIGIGTFMNTQLDYLSKLSKGSKILSAVSTGIAIISTTFSVIENMVNDINRGYDFDRVLSNTFTNIALYGGLTFGAGILGSKIGFLVGSAVPGLGNVVGAAVGFGTGVIFGAILDIEIDGKTIADHIRDGIYNFWQWLIRVIQ